MSDNTQISQEEAQVSNEKLLVQARMALKTGMSAYENGNYVFAETLLVKSMDLFEQGHGMQEAEYFQCLHQVADTYFQLGRYFEAKSYYERLSVARLKNPESTDAQVVVALLKLASTYQKLGEDAEALTAFDLIMELAEKTIPNGHALFGVIFDSFEELIVRIVSDPDELARREKVIAQKREQFGFPKATSEARWATAVAEPTEEEPGGEDGHAHNVLAQAPAQIRKNLRAWTSVDMVTPDVVAISESVSRVNQERLAELESNLAQPKVQRDDHRMQAHLHPNMFKRRSAAEMEADEAQLAEREKAYQLSQAADQNDPQEGAGYAGDGQAEGGSGEPSEVAAEQTPHRMFAGERGALKGVKRPDTDHKRFNPLPIISAVAGVAVVLGSVFVAYEYAKNSAVNQGTNAVATGKDYTNSSWSAADNKKALRCTSPANCSFTAGGATTSGTYTVAGQAGPDKSVLSELFNGKAAKFAFVESAAGLKSADGIVLYADDSKERTVLNKAQAIANFATYYYATHNHVYPSSAQDFTFNNARFAWENPLTGESNKPVVKKLDVVKADFENDFASNLKNMREGKAVFDTDSSTTSNVGLIECLALIPPAPAVGAPADEAPGCAFLIRAYDSEGKLISSSEANKTFVIALKNGISIDPIKALHEEATAPIDGKVEVTITPLPAEKTEAPAK